MRARETAVGIAAGVAIGMGAIAGLGLVSQSADAQRGGAVTQADLKAANQRSSAAINGYKSINNSIGKYLAEPEQLIGAKSGPIRQDRGIGGGLPVSVLSPEVQAMLAPAVRAVPSAPGAIQQFQTNTATARCAADEVVTGGGYELGDNAVAERSAPSADAKGWEVRAYGGPGGGSVQAFAMCRKS